MDFDIDLSLYVLLARKKSVLAGEIWDGLLDADTAMQFAHQGLKERRLSTKAEQLLVSAAEYLSSFK